MMYNVDDNNIQPPLGRMAHSVTTLRHAKARRNDTRAAWIVISRDFPPHCRLKLTVAKVDWKTFLTHNHMNESNVLLSLGEFLVYFGVLKKQCLQIILSLPSLETSPAGHPLFNNGLMYSKSEGNFLTILFVPTCTS